MHKLRSEISAQSGTKPIINVVGQLVRSIVCLRNKVARIAGVVVSRSSAAGGAAMLLGAATAQAGPLDGQVTAGSGSVTQSGANTTITQSSQNLSLSWKSFNVGAQESVNFVQPSASAIAVNRILDTNGSQILGQLNANGQVYLINPNGILFGAGAQVNVGGLVASTLDIKDADLNSSKRSFSGPGAGSVVNHGRINAAPGGYVALLGNTVSNQGSISAPLGSVVLGAGSAATLTFQGNQLLQVQIDQSVLNSLAENGGLIQADGGSVLMSAGARDSLLASAVNNSGVIQARTVENRNGTIILLGGMAAGTANIAGTLDASAPNGGNGGFIETSGAHVKIADSARITTAAPAGKTGTWLIDPVDFTIAAAGGNTTGALLSASLGTNNVVIESTTGNTGTAGDVNVNDVVSWNANELTLRAQNNININANLNASGTGKLALEYGQGTGPGTGTGYNFNNGAKINLPAGNNFSTKQGSAGTTTAYTVITDLGTATSATGTDLQGISGNLNGRYVLGADIDASATSGWNSGSGFTPLGPSNLSQFTGTLDGLGHTISGLTISRPTGTYVGLFGYVGIQGRINNLGLIGGSVSGREKVGALAGWSSGNIFNSYTTNTPVTGISSEAGGLVGTSQGDIRNSHASGNVTGGLSVGGLVGWGQGVIVNSYATGNVTGSNDRTGGLVGDMLNSGSISGSYASGNVSSTGSDVGGLVGLWNSNGSVSSINNSYATGTASGNSRVGGLVGRKIDPQIPLPVQGTINNSYATGAVSGTSDLGGLVGLWVAGIAINNSFWDSTTTGQNASSGGGMAMATADMQQQANFSSATLANGNVNPNWDFTSVWRIYEGNSRPLLKALMKATTVTVGSTSKTYDRLAWNGGTGISCSNVACGSLSGSISFSGTAQGAVNAGSYTVTGSGLYSNQQGYDISYANGTLTVNPASLAVTGVGADNKVYDAGTTATLNGTASVTAIAGDTVSVTGTGNGTFVNKNVGNGKAVTVTGYTLSGADAGNYTVVQPTGLTANITPASLAVTGVGANNKVYDTTTTATLNGTASVTAIAGDTVSVAGTGSGAFADKNVGNGKAVAVTGYTLSGADAGNYTVVQPTGLTANITPASLAVTGVGANNKVYDTTTTATLSGTAAVAALGGDTVTVGGGSGNFANKNVGNGKAVTVTGYTLGGADAGNYTVVQPTAVTANITPASLTVTGVNANNKVYDTTTTATLSGTAAVAALGGDTVTVGGTGSGNFANKNVGNGKAVTVTGYTLGGADAGNYTVVQPTAVTANITPASLTVTGVNANNKVYDTTTTATLSGTAAVAALGGDAVTVGGGSGNFNNKNVGNGKAVTVTGYTLSGADASNYTVVQPTGMTANITPASLAVTGVGANNKVYDTTTTATLNGTAAVTALGGDVLAVAGTGSGSFANKNVGNGKAVTVTGYTLSGADAGNYTVVQPAAVTANITPASLTVAGVNANNKVYDTTTAATLSGTAAVTALGGDVVTVGGGSGAFANKNVANGKAVTVTGYTLGGADAGNYTVVQPTGLSANITPASLTVTGVGANNKVYDTTTTATLNGTANVAALGGDVVTVGGGSGAFADKNVGNGKAVTVTGYTLGGADAGNYVITQPTGVMANITPAALVVNGVGAANKVYDASNAATLNGTAGVAAIAGDTVSVGGTGSATFANKNVGNGKTVTVTGYTLSGADAGNYVITQPTGVTANITPASRAVTGVGADNKVYNASDAATLNGTAGIAAFSGDTVTVSGGSGTFANKNVGNGKTVTVTGFTLGGADAGNYVITQPTGVTANITPAALAVTGVGAANKVYDASNAATLNGAASVAAFAGDTVTLGGAGSGAFANKNVGNGKTVTVTGYTLSGADAGNYVVTQPAGVTANITPASLAVTGVGADNKVYNASNGATLNGTASITALSGDVVTVGGGSGAFVDKNVGNGKTVTVTGYVLSGADAGNYTVVQPSGLTANITPASLAVTGIGANNKVYDASSAATLNGTANVAAFAGDTVILGGTGGGTFADKNVGNGKAVTVTGYTLSGTDAGNYVITQPVGVTASITPASLAVTGVGAANKVYDGTTAATLNGTANVAALGTDVVTVGGIGSGAFANANVGNGKSVAVTGFTLGGADAANYTVVQPAGLTAAITPAPVPVTGSTPASAFASASAATSGRGVDSATQQAQDEARAKSEVPEASSTLQVIHIASTDARDGKEPTAARPAIEKPKDTSIAGGQDPRLHIVDGGVRVRRNMFASQE
ncbi:YDG domain-containing protein [Polaromonas sp. A23]|uniref:YDG domain-containing protein n=1 Tax=Polaromonas sp. A23 TaxID=1944133 RepID=UPI000985EA9B|nr:YDG domain-containing protein [Polaromonas sp. A23]OOG41010.1 hypothetical protein B0B52_11705 [Polaromonas sp. A23]